MIQTATSAVRRRISYLRQEAAPRATYRRPRVDFVAEDWDTLIILDACRHDLFRDVVDDTADSRIAPGSATPEVLRRTFDGRDCHDVVYVTANPIYRRASIPVDDHTFHAVVDVWAEHWDECEKTVRPAPVADAIRAARERYPDKRILGQFLQPHYPMLGPTGEAIDHSGIESTFREVTGNGQGPPDDPTIWTLLERGVIDRATAWQAYRENLAVAWPHVEALVDDLAGRVVVTSDHGNLLGERPTPVSAPTFGHPAGVHCDGLCRVPWLSFRADSRPAIAADPPRAELTDRPAINQRLSALGYHEGIA